MFYELEFITIINTNNKPDNLQFSLFFTKSLSVLIEFYKPEIYKYINQFYSTILKGLYISCGKFFQPSNEFIRTKFNYQHYIKYINVF